MYFISDAHLGLFPSEKSAIREKRLVDWLDSIEKDVSELYLLGDIFDFWHEYRHVVPRGYTRFLGKLSELADAGVKIHYFTGNHDVWIYDYLPAEIGLTLYRSHVDREMDGRLFYIGHGDGLGSGEKGYKILKWIFNNRTMQWLFARIHPNAAMKFGKWWSKKSRYAKGIVAEAYKGDENEFQVVFAREMLRHRHYDYFIFGHRHIPFEVRVGKNSKVINLGDWITSFTYAVWDGLSLELHSIDPEKESGILRK
ncbi:MAG: UDP-2,3-diacylglucosamine diphosphatase [Bacteroidales bacterium]|nr:UDP-2,3-diacylglucosamine diphosphatase [Bacteroidales bacterium]